MFTADIYLSWECRWLHQCPLPTFTEWEAQRLAEAIALCYGASLSQPSNNVFGLRRVEKEGAIAA